MLNLDRDVSWRPAHSRGDRRQPDAVAQRGGKPFHDAVVAVEHATDPAFTHVAARTAARGQRALADAAWIRGVKALHELPRQAALMRQPAAAGAGAQKLVERPIRTPLRVKPAHDHVEPPPEVVEWFGRTTADLPPPTADVVRGELRLPQDLFRLRRAAMNELGAELDRHRRVAITM